MALGQQDGTCARAKGQRAGAIGMLKRNVGAVHGAGLSPARSTQPRAGQSMGEAQGAFAELS